MTSGEQFVMIGLGTLMLALCVKSWTTLLLVSEWVCVWVSVWVSEWVSEWVGEWVSEWVSEWVRAWVSERVVNKLMYFFSLFQEVVPYLEPHSVQELVLYWWIMYCVWVKRLVWWTACLILTPLTVTTAKMSVSSATFLVSQRGLSILRVAVLIFLLTIIFC